MSLEVREYWKLGKVVGKQGKYVTPQTLGRACLVWITGVIGLGRPSSLDGSHW